MELQRVTEKEGGEEARPSRFVVQKLSRDSCGRLQCSHCWGILTNVCRGLDSSSCLGGVC